MMLSKVVHCISNLDDIKFEITAFHQDFWSAHLRCHQEDIAICDGSPYWEPFRCNWWLWLWQFAQTITFFQHAMLAKLRCLPKEAARLQMNASLAGSGVPMSIDRAARISSKCPSGRHVSRDHGSMWFIHVPPLILAHRGFAIEGPEMNTEKCYCKTIQ